jgi:hypothetical protein
MDDATTDMDALVDSSDAPPSVDEDVNQPARKPKRPRARSNAAADGTTESVAESAVVKKAKILLAAKQSSLGDEVLWKGRVKTRQVQQAAASLEQAALKFVGGDNPATATLVDDMMKFGEDLRAKHELFSSMRSQGPAFLLSAWEGDDRQTIVSLKPSLVAEIFVFYSKELLKGGDQERVCVCWVAWRLARALGQLAGPSENAAVV